MDRGDQRRFQELLLAQAVAASGTEAAGFEVENKPAGEYSGGRISASKLEI